MSKLVIHPALSVKSFKPVIILSKEQMNALVVAETNRQVHSQLNGSQDKFKVSTVVDFRTSDDRLQGSLVELQERLGHELTNIDKVTTSVLTTLCYGETPLACGILETEYRTNLDKAALCQLIKEVYEPPEGFVVEDVGFVISFESSIGSVFKAKVTLAVKE